MGGPVAPRRACGDCSGRDWHRGQANSPVTHNAPGGCKPWGCACTGRPAAIVQSSRHDATVHIGGKIRADGWEVLNASAGPHVDHVDDAKDLSRFADATFAAIYASHVVEHLDYDKELLATLIEYAH